VTVPADVGDQLRALAEELQARSLPEEERRMREAEEEMRRGVHAWLTRLRETLGDSRRAGAWLLGRVPWPDARDEDFVGWLQADARRRGVTLTRRETEEGLWMRRAEQEIWRLARAGVTPEAAIGEGDRG
jgi:hypothetical protein